MFGPNSPKMSQQRPLSQMALPGFKNAFETSPKKPPAKKITQYLPIPFLPLSSANGHAETEAEWGSGVNGDGSPGGRKRKGGEKALEPIEDAIPRSGGTQLGMGSSPPVLQFGDVGELGLMDPDGRGGGESDGDEFIPLSLAGEVMFSSMIS